MNEEEEIFTCEICLETFGESQLNEEPKNESRNFSEELFFPCCGRVVQ